VRLAAIDIGSNAARLLITEVRTNSNGKPEFNKLSLVRVPLRLGFDVFDNGFIPEDKIAMFIKTIKAYKYLLDVYEVKEFRACATSAMRDASNSKEIIDRIKAETDISISIISGKDEASFIYDNHIAESMNDEDSYLYIDVGGGSTELTYFSDGKLIFKESFNIGTIRLLKNQVSEKEWDDMKEFIKKNTTGYHHVTAIGSGGNINKVFSLSKRKEGKPLSLQLLRDYYKEFNSLTLEQRISMYHLREDRADVIVPALLIYVNVMRWADADEIYVPRIGLADGLVKSMYYAIKKQPGETSKPSYVSK